MRFDIMALPPMRRLANGLSNTGVLSSVMVLWEKPVF